MARQLLASGLLAVKGDHGTLALTDLSAEVLRGERQVTVATGRPGRPRRRREAGGAVGGLRRTRTALTAPIVPGGPHRSS